MSGSLTLVPLVAMVVGKWTLEEYQSLFDLVNADLQLKAFEERKTKHGMVCSSISSLIYLIIFLFCLVHDIFLFNGQLRENISWGTISEKMTTRFEMNCCMKWFSMNFPCLLHSSI